MYDMVNFGTPRQYGIIQGQIFRYFLASLEEFKKKVLIYIEKELHGFKCVFPLAESMLVLNNKPQLYAMSNLDDDF